MSKTADVPMEIYLPEAEVELLQKLAQEQGVTVGEFLRRSIHEFLSRDLEEQMLMHEDASTQLDAEPDVTENPLWGIVGLGQSGLTDVAARHDQHLADILHEERH
jgi:hypothetical protein